MQTNELSSDLLRRLADFRPDGARVTLALSEACIQMIGGGAQGPLAQRLLLTAPLATTPAPQCLTFSGGANYKLRLSRNFRTTVLYQERN